MIFPKWHAFTAWGLSAISFSSRQKKIRCSVLTLTERNCILSGTYHTNRGVMKFFWGILCLAIAFTDTAFAKQKRRQNDFSRAPVPQQHYQPEYAFDKPINMVRWTEQKAGIHAAFGSTDELYVRSEVPAVNELSPIWKESGWRGQRLNAQVLVWSPDSVEQIRFLMNDLVNSAGTVISRDNIMSNRGRLSIKSCLKSI